MPRANRFFVAGAVWHITHRCHGQQFLLKFERDRSRWKYWLFQATQRYGLCVLNYIATSNHVHLLVRDTGRTEISRSMQLISGRTAQEYNQRKSRKGAFWEDRYFATAVGTDRHLTQLPNVQALQTAHLNWVKHGLQDDKPKRQPCWTESLAFGSENFVMQVKAQLRTRALYRAIKSDSQQTFRIQDRKRLESRFYTRNSRSKGKKITK